MRDEGIASVLIAALFFYLGYAYAKKQDVEPTYGETGLPKNCVAIVHENAEGVRRREHSAMDALNSIERNCGRYGYSLKE